MIEILNAIEAATDLPINPLSSHQCGEQIVYSIIPLADNGVVKQDRLELNIVCSSLARTIEKDNSIRKALLSIGDLEKNGVLSIELNGGGTLESEVGVHRFTNYTITTRSEI